MGPQCTRCRPLFVGDPRNNGQCISCFEYCNGHTPVCHGHNLSLAVTAEELLPILTQGWSKTVEAAWIRLIGEGPKTQAICHACSNLVRFYFIHFYYYYYYLNKNCSLHFLPNRLWVKSVKNVYQEIFVEWKTDGNLVDRASVTGMATCVIRYDKPFVL